MAPYFSELYRWAVGTEVAQAANVLYAETREHAKSHTLFPGIVEHFFDLEQVFPSGLFSVPVLVGDSIGGSMILQFNRS